MKTVMDWFRVGPEYRTRGDIGIEVEVEGIRLPDAPRGWRREQDGSLRGEDTAEYVFKEPVSLPNALDLLGRLDAAYKAQESVVDDSVRAGVHVHINMQECSIIQTYNMMTLYYTLENVLTTFCGEGREGNLFCLRAKDAPEVISRVAHAAKTGMFRQLVDDNLRYAAMNVKCLGTYGSLEFRAMRGTRDLDRIHEWATILYNLRERAKLFASPVDVIKSYSEGDALGFLTNMLGDDYKHFKHIPEDTLKVMLKEGMRLAQEVAYSTNWLKYADVPDKLVGGVPFPNNGVLYNEPMRDI